jgi:aldose 1-epimerase
MKKLNLVTIILVSVTFASCNQSIKNKEMVRKEVFGTHKGKEVYLLTLTNKSGNVIRLTNFGARITWIEVPDREGKKDNVTFGFDTFESTINGDPYFGAVVGRYGNRIAKGSFTLDGVKYSLAINNPPNALHGGPLGWHSLVWETKVVDKATEPTVEFKLKSPDMEEGYPGNMEVTVVYKWTDKNEIVIDYTCTTDKKTVLNITNHAYFNLSGAGNGDILNHVVTIKSSAITPVDSTLIPTGELRPVAGTPFDFTSPHTVGERIGEKYDQLLFGGGYDHNFVLDNKEEVDATVYEPVSGRLMEVITDQPGVQFYCGNFLDGKFIGHGGKPYNYRSGLCLETQHFPDSPNQPAFPSAVLNPGESFKSSTTYRFSVK